MGYMCSENRKKVQRALNKVVRKVNQNIKEDKLWRGRFVIKQTSAWWVRRQDCDGHRLVVEFCFVDQKTGFSVSEISEANRAMMLNGSWLYRRMNTFICVDIDVWKNEGLENLRKDS